MMGNLGQEMFRRKLLTAIEGLSLSTGIPARECIEQAIEIFGEITKDFKKIDEMGKHFTPINLHGFQFKE